MVGRSNIIQVKGIAGLMLDRSDGIQVKGQIGKRSGRSDGIQVKGQPGEWPHRVRWNKSNVSLFMEFGTGCS